MREFYKVFVTKDFPRIYEQRVHFDCDASVAIISEGHWAGRSDSDYWIDAIVLNKGEWFWSFDGARDNWEDRRLAGIDKITDQIKSLEDKMLEVATSNRPERTDIPEEFYCRAMPDGREAQVARYKSITARISKKRAEAEIASLTKSLEVAKLKAADNE